MRINSEIDIRNEAMIFSAIAFMSVGSVYLTASMGFSLQMAAIGCTAVIVASALLLWFLFGSYYELHEEHLFIRCGPFTESIRYDDIVCLRLIRDTSSSMALSSKRIEIQQYCDGILTETMISPKNRKAFLTHLKDRCRYLEDAA
jgi:hypothetical protein